MKWLTDFNIENVTLQSFTWASWHQCKVYLCLLCYTQEEEEEEGVAIHRFLQLYLGELLTENDKDSISWYNTLDFKAFLRIQEDHF